MMRLPSLLQSLRSRSAVRAVGAMALSSAVGQLAVFGTLPLLTRLYDPAAFGKHSLLMAFVGVASVGVCLCLDHRIVSTADDAEADNMFAASIYSIGAALLVSVAALSLLIGFKRFGYGALPWWAVPVMALMIGLNGLFSACRSRVVRQQDFALIAQTSLAQNIGRALAPIALFPLLPFWLGLTGGELGARLLGVRKLMRSVWHRRLGTPVWQRPRLWWSVLRREYRFTGVLLSTVLVDACASQMISPLLASTYGAQAAGEYFLVAMLVVGPSALIGGAASDVIHARGAAIFHSAPHELPRFLRRSALALLGLALAIFLPVYALAPFALPLLFGAAWPNIGESVSAMIPFAIVGFVASPCARLLASINRPTIKVVSDGFRLGGVPAVIYFSHDGGQPFVEAIRNLSWFLALAYLLYFGLTYVTISLVAREAR